MKSADNRMSVCLWQLDGLPLRILCCFMCSTSAGSNDSPFFHDFCCYSSVLSVEHLRFSLGFTGALDASELNPW